MKVLNKLNDPELGKKIVGSVQKLAAQAAERLGRPILLMEVCGTHTMAISRTGLRGLLFGLVELRSGPGCPVCVTDASDIERMLAFTQLSNVLLATFGDMIRVPGTWSSLEKERARGAKVKILYSPADAINMAQQNPDLEVVFLGVGFETTAPLVALSINHARALKINNFSIYSVHKTVPQVMRALLSQGDVRVDGFILPGHVCAVTGSRAFNFIGEDYGIPAVVAGFTPVDMLDAIHILLEKILAGDVRTYNGYRWVVKDEGNTQAQKIMATYFYPGDASWRGFGIVPGSGLYLREEFAKFDARQRFTVEIPGVIKQDGCRCGDLLRGLITPPDCAMFGRTCTPANPVGPCMVSSEGACAAYYKNNS